MRTAPINYCLFVLQAQNVSSSASIMLQTANLLLAKARQMSPRPAPKRPAASPAGGSPILTPAAAGGLPDRTQTAAAAAAAGGSGSLDLAALLAQKLAAIMLLQALTWQSTAIQSTIQAASSSMPPAQGRAAAVGAASITPMRAAQPQAATADAALPGADASAPAGQSPQAQEGCAASDAASPFLTPSSLLQTGGTPRASIGSHLHQRTPSHESASSTLYAGEAAGVPSASHAANMRLTQHAMTLSRLLDVWAQAAFETDRLASAAASSSVSRKAEYHIALGCVRALGLESGLWDGSGVLEIAKQAVDAINKL